MKWLVDLEYSLDFDPAIAPTHGEWCGAVESDHALDVVQKAITQAKAETGVQWAFGWECVAIRRLNDDGTEKR